MTDPMLGMDCVAYYSDTNLDGVTLTPHNATWVEVDNFRDLRSNLTKGEADVTTRANDGWEATLATLKRAEVTGQVMWLPGDTAFDALLDAFMNNTLIAMAFMDGTIGTGGHQGLVANFSVTGFTRNEALQEGVTVDITLKPASQIEWFESVAS